MEALTVGLFLAIIVGTSLASWLGHKPIIWSLNSVTSRGVGVWPILLDKETAPVTYHRLALVHKEMGEEEKAAKEFKKAYISYRSNFTDVTSPSALDRYGTHKNAFFDTRERTITVGPL